MKAHYPTEDDITISVLRNAIRQLKARPEMFEVRDDITEVIHGFEYGLQWCLHLPLDKSQHTYHKDFQEDI